MRSGPGQRASAGQLLAAVHATGSRAVVVLPGDRDTLMAAEVAAQAASGEGVDVHVVPARTTVQALAALAVLDPARSVHANVVAMTGAAVSTRHGAVSPSALPGRPRLKPASKPNTCWSIQPCTP